MRFFGIMVLLAAFSQLATATGIEFFEGSWAEALVEADRQDKLIFVDAYAVWCGPCKRMSREVFTDERVGDFYNQHFINVKMDMERGEGLHFRKKYPVSAFPTLFYIDAKGEVVQRVRGARPVDAFLNLGHEALSKVDNSEEYAEAYERGDRDPDLVYKYIQSLNRAGKSSLKIANDYLRDQEAAALGNPENLRIIFEGATEADSRIFEWLIQYKAPIIAMETEEAFLDKVEQACLATVDKGIEFSYRELVDEAISKMKKYAPDRAQAFELEAEMEYTLAADEPKGYAKACKTYARKVIDEDPAALSELAQKMVLHFKESPATLKEAESIAREAAEQGQQYGYYLTYAHVLALNGKEKAALKALEKSMELAKAEGSDRGVQMVERYLKRING